MDHSEGGAKPSLASLRIDADARDEQRSGRGWVVWVVVAAVLLAAAAVALVFGGRAAVVETTRAQAPGSGENVTLLNASGYVTPRRRATVAAKITGRVVEMAVEEGDVVREGQVLARLDDADAKVRLAAAVAEQEAAAAALAELGVRLENARRELHRAAELEAGGVGSERAADLARTDAEALEAQIELARSRVEAAAANADVYRQDLDNYTVRAPFDGVAVSKDAQPGEMVSPVSAGGGFTRTGIATIVDMNSLEIEVDVNEANIARVTSGQRVDAVLDAYPDWHIPARVLTVIPTADRQKATVRVRIAFESLDPRILPDMGVKVAFLAAEESSRQAVARALVPKAALRRDGERDVVYVVEDGRLQRRAVSVGAVQGAAVEILAGVDPGEQVVVSGPAQLEDGQRVTQGRN